jgi:hypothetical protein
MSLCVEALESTWRENPPTHGGVENSVVTVLCIQGQLKEETLKAYTLYLTQMQLKDFTGKARYIK